jgi:hypothetical protein
MLKRILVVLKVTALAILVLAGGVAGWWYTFKPAKAPARNLVIERTPDRIARGKYLFTLADCDGCHSERDFSRFGGPIVAGKRGAGQVLPKEMGLPGLVAPPNITPDADTGIGTWTDGEKVRAIREGVDKDGRTLFPMMPYSNFRKMSDEDVFSLVAFLDTLEPVNNKLPKTKINFPVSELIKGAPQPVAHVAQPDHWNKMAYGEYLVNVAGCRDCHTPDLSGGERFNVAPGVAVVSANITPDNATGIGPWSEDYFVDRFAQYREYVAHGSPEAGPSSFTLMPWLNFAQLHDEDLRAIYAFVRSQKPVSKAVETHPGFDPKPAVPPPAQVSRR